MPIDPAIDARLRQLSRRQHAAVRRDQLLAAGVTRAQIATRVQRGEWQRAFHSVYILGDPTLIPLSIESAVLLSLGPDSALHHRTAGFLWDLARPKPQVVEVTIPRSNARSRPGVRIHLTQSLDPKDIRHRDGLRVTSPARTIIDLAADSSSTELEHATSEAVAQRLMTDIELQEALDRTPANHPGAARLRARLSIDPDLLLRTRSVAERIAYPLILDAGLPRPRLNEIVQGLRVDMHWPDHKLIVEIDGFQYHSSRHAFENDRRRDQILIAAGYTVIRITWHQLTNEPYKVVAAIAQALASARPHPAAA